MATKFITVSIDIMHDKNLNQSQKFILAEIEQLCSLDGGCFASNYHFAELIGITKENVSRNLNDLKEMGYIDIKIENGSRNHIRIITLTKIVRPPYQNSKTPLLKQQETKDNIQNNIQSNNTIVISQAQSLIDEWNEFAVKHGLSKVVKLTDNRKKKIQARFKDCPTFDKVFTYLLHKVSNSDFLLGNSTKWKVDFDFLVESEQNYVKISEGKYDNRKDEY